MHVRVPQAPKTSKAAGLALCLAVLFQINSPPAGAQASHSTHSAPATANATDAKAPRGGRASQPALGTWVMLVTQVGDGSNQSAVKQKKVPEPWETQTTAQEIIRYTPQKQEISSSYDIVLPAREKKLFIWDIDPSAHQLKNQIFNNETAIPWDEWYTQVWRTLSASWARCANRPGEVVLRITVLQGQHLLPQILGARTPVKGDENNLKIVAMTACNALEGNAVLAFPSQSKRSQISFNVELYSGGNPPPANILTLRDHEDVRSQ